MNKTQLQWLTEGVAHADGADDVVWAWELTHGLVDIIAVQRRKPETENNVNKQQQQQQHTTGTATYGGQCSASVAEAREALLAFVRQSTEALALAPIAEVAGGSVLHQKEEKKNAELGFEDLLNCVLDVVAEEEECATSATLVNKLLLTSTKIVQRSSDALVANSNRYAVFLDPSVLGADLARKAAKTCLETTLRAPPAITARLAESPRDAVLCLSQEWATPDGATAATGRYYYQREGAAGTVTEEPIQSWQWNLAGSAANADTTIVPRVYSRHQGNTTTAGAAAGAAAAAHVCGEEGFPASSVVDLAQLSAITAIEACWAVAKAGAASKHDLRIAPATFGAVSSALRLPNDLAQHPLFAAVHDTAVSLVAASQESATLYFSPQEIDASSPFGAVTPADDADALLDLAEQQCAAAADGKVIPAPALGAWAAEVEPKLAAAFGLADLGNFMDDGFGKRHRHWSGAATTGVTVQDIQAGLTAAFDAGGSSGMLLNYRRNTARVSAEHGPQTASDLFAELAARGAAEPLSAVLEDADKLQFDTDADGIAKLRDELQKVLGFEVNVNMYLSAENAAALPPHTDRYDVFVVQLHGAKDWNICPPAASAATTGLNEAEAAMELELAKHSPNGCSAHKNVKSDGTLDCKSVKMAVGDVLYMPKGLIHEAKSVAAGGLSAHLTIGLVQDGLTWTDLFEANAKRLSNVVASSSPAVASRLANAVNAVANSVPAGVAWHRALPVGASQQAIGSLHNYYDDLGKQLQAAATATLNAATDPFGAQRAEVVAAVQELTRADMMLAGISELQRRAADAREQDSEAASELINVAFESALEVSLLKRSRRAVGSCHKGQANSRFTCPDSGRSFDKNMLQPIGESCECDDYYGSSCECDTNTKYGKCEVDKNKCKCPPGKRIVGCAKDSAYSGGVCGSCIWNGPGDFCSISDVKFQCQNGLACLDGYCCHKDVMQQYCTSCAKVGTTKAGKCDKWEKGYKGDYADPQRNGCEKGYYLSPDKSRCLPASSGGDVCSKDSECTAGPCLDKRCCGANVDASACSACGTRGECTACKDTGKDPAFGCARCFANGYFEASRSSGTSFTCLPKLQVGKFCQKPDSDNANGDWIDDHTRCITFDCRNNCCGPDVLAYCSRCGESGECAACPDTFSLAALDNGQQVCKQTCTKDDGTRVEHADADTRIMYESNEPIGDKTCEQMAQSQTRTCNDGTFGAWETEDGNNPNDVATCSDRCNAPSVENVFVCDGDRASGANDCDSAATTPYVKHGYVVVRVRYLTPSVEPGQECQGENQTQSCIDGELDDLASKCTDGMSTAQQGRAGCTYYTFSTCNVNCAAGCTLEKELDEKQCHDECDVEACYFQHGTCASPSTTTASSTTASSTTVSSTTSSWLQVNDKCDPLADTCDKAKRLACSMEVYECRYMTTTATTAPSGEDSVGVQASNVSDIIGGALGGLVFLVIFSIVVYRCGRKKDLEDVRARIEQPQLQNHQQPEPAAPKQAYGQTYHNPAFKHAASQRAAACAEISDGSACEPVDLNRPARSNHNIGAGLGQEGDYAEIEDIENGGGSNSNSTNHPASSMSRCKYKQGDDANGKQCNTTTASKWCEKHSCEMVSCPNSKSSRAKVCAACQHQRACDTADDDDYLEPSAEQVRDYDNGLLPGASDFRASGTGGGGGRGGRGGGAGSTPSKNVAQKRSEKQQPSVYLGFGQEDEKEDSMV